MVSQKDLTRPPTLSHPLLPLQSPPPIVIYLCRLPQRWLGCRARATCLCSSRLLGLSWFFGLGSFSRSSWGVWASVSADRYDSVLDLEVLTSSAFLSRLGGSGGLSRGFSCTGTLAGGYEHVVTAEGDLPATAGVGSVASLVAAGASPSVAVVAGGAVPLSVFLLLNRPLSLAVKSETGPV
jgi:hypothetical protein